MAEPERLTTSEVEAKVPEETPQIVHCPDCGKNWESHWPSKKVGGERIERRCDECQHLYEEAQRRRQRRERRERTVGKVEVPPYYRDAYIQTFKGHGPPDDRAKRDLVRDHANRYVEGWPDVPSVVLMIGAPGTGKGHVAYSILRSLRDVLDVVPWFAKLPDVIRDLREAWGRHEGPTEAERLRKYREADLLVIDEISRHAFYGEPHRHLYDLVDYRVEWMRPTILTTNESLGEFEEIVGPAILSRIAGESGVWDFGETDYRPLRRRKR